MKILKAFFAMFFVLFSVSTMSAQSCMDTNGFTMQIGPQIIAANGAVCYDVLIRADTDLPSGIASLFIQVEGTSYEFISSPGDEEFSATVCFGPYPMNMIAPTEATIVCGISPDSTTDHPLCFDGCTVTIEPIPITGRG